MPLEDFARWRVRLDGDLARFTPRDLERVVRILREAANDNDLFPLGLTAGSVCVDIASRRDAFARVRQADRADLSRRLESDVLSIGDLSAAFAPTLPPEPSASDAERPAWLDDKDDAARCRPIIGIRNHPADGPAYQWKWIFGGGKDGCIDPENARLGLHLFLEAATTPGDDLWVNLGPAESHRIMTDRLAGLELGRTMLEADLRLKQLSAWYLRPDHEVGARYWAELSRLLAKGDNVTRLAIEPHFRLWMVPGKIQVFVSRSSGSMIIESATLDIKGEEMHRQPGFSPKTRDGEREATDEDQIVWEALQRIVVPELRRELNEGPAFARFRQSYYALIFSGWFRDEYKSDPRYAQLLKSESVPAMQFTVTAGGQPVPYRSHEWRRPGESRDRPLADICREAVNATYQAYLDAFHRGVCYVVTTDRGSGEGPMMVRSFFSGAVDVRKCEGDLAGPPCRDVIAPSEMPDAGGSIEAGDPGAATHCWIDSETAAAQRCRPLVGIVKHAPHGPAFHWQWAFDGGGELDPDNTAASVHMFFEAASIPSEQVWVNLGPGDSDGVMPERLAELEIGRTILEGDLRLKQLAAWYLRPDNLVGARYWAALARALRTDDNVTRMAIEPHFRLWMVHPGIKVEVDRDVGTAVVSSAPVELRSEDLHGNQGFLPSGRYGERVVAVDDVIAWQVLEEIVLPELTRQLNEGPQFAPMRQAYGSILVGGWFRREYACDSRYAALIHGGTVPDMDFNIETDGRETVYRPRDWRRPGDPPDRPLERICREAVAATYERYLGEFGRGVACVVPRDCCSGVGPMMVRSFFSGAMGVR
jgi:hypothetical protein